MFRLFHKETPHETYDAENLTPAVRSSICTGEKTAGFVEKSGGRFREVMLVRSEADLQKFREMYGIEGEIKTVY